MRLPRLRNLSLGPPTRFAGLSRRGAVLGLVAFAGLLGWALANRALNLPAFGMPLAWDLNLHREVVRRVHAGENHYDLYAVLLPAGQYNSGSTFNWRLPTYAAVLGALPDPTFGRWLMIGASLFSVAVTASAVLGRDGGRVRCSSADAGPVRSASAVLGRDGGRVAVLGGAVLLLGGAFAGSVYDPDLYVCTEPWCEVFLLLSLAAYAAGRWPLGVAAALAALALRELSLAYCVVAAGLAWRAGRRAEVRVWAVAFVVAGLLYWLHMGEVARRKPGTVPNPADWLDPQGLFFVMRAGTMNLWVRWLSNESIVAYFVAAVVGLAGWGGPVGTRVGLSAAIYGVPFLFVRTYEYWGYFVTPFLILGLVRAPAAFRDLCAAAFRGGGGAMTPLRLAWANLAHKRTRTLIAAAGVAFAVVLVFMQFGLYGGVGRTATILYEKLQFDLLLVSPEYLDLSRPGEFPRARVERVTASDGVADATPLLFGAGTWRLPVRRAWPWADPSQAGAVTSINLIGVPPDRLDRTFTTGEGDVFPTVEAARTAGAELARLDAFLLDRRSRSEFGTVEEWRADPDGGRLNGRRAAVVGGFDLGTGFSWNGMLMGSEATFARATFRPADEVNLGLIRLKSGADPVAVRGHLRATLPPDVQVLTREEMIARERDYWTRLTSVGQFLLVAAVLAVVVGVIFVYQMMAADIRTMLPEYATVKALGYPPGYLSAVVLWQALLLAALGYVPGFVVVLGLYRAATEWGGIPTVMTTVNAVSVFALTAGMCLASGLLAVRRVHAADPADLF